MWAPSLPTTVVTALRADASDSRAATGRIVAASSAVAQNRRRRDRPPPPFPEEMSAFRRDDGGGGPGAPDPRETTEAMVGAHLSHGRRVCRRRGGGAVVHAGGVGRAAAARRGCHGIPRPGGLRASPARRPRAARRLVPAVLPRVPGVPVQRARGGLVDGSR